MINANYVRKQSKSSSLKKHFVCLRAQIYGRIRAQTTNEARHGSRQSHASTVTYIQLYPATFKQLAKKEKKSNVCASTVVRNFSNRAATERRKSKRKGRKKVKTSRNAMLSFNYRYIRHS